MTWGVPFEGGLQLDCLKVCPRWAPMKFSWEEREFELVMTLTLENWWENSAKYHLIECPGMSLVQVPSRRIRKDLTRLDWYLPTCWPYIMEPHWLRTVNPSGECGVFTTIRGSTIYGRQVGKYQSSPVRAFVRHMCKWSVPVTCIYLAKWIVQCKRFQIDPIFLRWQVADS